MPTCKECGHEARHLTNGLCEFCNEPEDNVKVCRKCGALWRDDSSHCPKCNTEH